MKKLSALIFIFLIGCMIGCAPVSVSYDYDEATDFTHLRQYSWSDISLKGQADELTVKRVKQAIDRQLQSKGFTPTTATPDFMIVLRSSTKTVKDITEWSPRYYGYGSYWSGGPRYRGYGSYWHGPQVSVYEYEEATFILDFIATANAELIWRGSATWTVEPQLAQDAKSKRTKETVAQLLKNFPPPLKK